MSLYANTKLKTKLIIGFVFISLLAAATSVIGLTSIKSIVAINREISDTYIGMLDNLTDVNSEMRDLRIYTRDLALTTDKAKMDEYIAKMDDTEKSLLANIEDFKSKVAPDDTTTMNAINNFSDLIGSYITKRHSINDLLYSNDPQGTAEIYVAEFATISSDMLTSANTLTSRVRQLTADATTRQKSLESMSDIIMISAGVVALALGVMLGLFLAGSIAKMLKKISGAINEVAAGDFTVEVDIHDRSELGLLASQVNSMIARLRDVLLRVNDVSLVVDDASRQVASSSMSLAQISTEQAGSSQEISSSMLDITARAKTNSDDADKASAISDGTRTKAVEGNERMNEMLQAMEAINEASANISNIIKVIDDIAFQTNILALNAAVEAARAGTHGKGFAVVAEEVRTLSARSATAASETTNMIENSIKEVKHGTVIARETADSLKDILNGVAETAELIKNISDASRRQSQEAAQINGGVEQISQAIQTTSSVAQEAASSSSELADQSATLKELVSAFKFSSAADDAFSAAGRRAVRDGRDRGAARFPGIHSATHGSDAGAAAGEGGSQGLALAAGAENFGNQPRVPDGNAISNSGGYGKY